MKIEIKITPEIKITATITPDKKKSPAKQKPQLSNSIKNIIKIAQK